MFESTTTEVEHWLFGVVTVHRRWRTTPTPETECRELPCGARSGREPVRHRIEDRCDTGLSLFRFEGVAPRVLPASAMPSRDRFVGVGGRSPRAHRSFVQ